MDRWNMNRRDVIKTFGLSVGSALLAGLSARSAVAKEGGPSEIVLADKSLHVLSDGNLSLPLSRIFATPEQEAEAMALFEAAGLSTTEFTPPVNITLMKSEDRLVLFDCGAGSQFMDTTGLLPAALEAIGVDPYDVSDVVFTHAHPDHCWGLLDDFDELISPDATYHMHGAEFDYWMSEDTLNNTDEASLGMVAGARNRLPLIEEQLNRFNWGDEVLPGIEAIDTHGHTAGHTSFAVHSGSESVMVLGDALVHPVLSFQRPDWKWMSDQDVDAAVNTRKTMLDRLAGDKMRMIGFHLPGAGIGTAEKRDGEYRYVAI